MNKLQCKRGLRNAAFHSGLLQIFVFLAFTFSVHGRTLGENISIKAEEGAYPVINKGTPSDLMIGENEFPGVERVMGYFRNDLRMVSGKEPMLYKGEKHILGDVIIAGTLGQSELIDKLVNNKKVDLSA
ncbi:MAG: hypothetical protein R6W78_09125, partial [Bacteroidales bacterium]